MIVWYRLELTLIMNEQARQPPMDLRAAENVKSCTSPDLMHVRKLFLLGPVKLGPSSAQGSNGVPNRF